MLRVFCVCVGDRYGWDHVIKLASMFDRHLKIPFLFYCSTDKSHVITKTDSGREIKLIKPRRECWGWWNLQEAYSDPWWAKGEQILYTGLDTVITGDITDVVKRRCDLNRLTLLHDFQCLLPKDQRSSLYADSFADGVAFVPRGGVPFLWGEFIREVGPFSDFPMHVYNTGLLKEHYVVPDFWQDFAPGFICSYKWPTVKTECPPEPIVCFHGEPRPQEAAEQTPWIKEHWR